MGKVKLLILFIMREFVVEGENFLYLELYFDFDIIYVILNKFFKFSFFNCFIYRVFCYKGKMK